MPQVQVLPVKSKPYLKTDRRQSTASSFSKGLEELISQNVMEPKAKEQILDTRQALYRSGIMGRIDRIPRK